MRGLQIVVFLVFEREFLLAVGIENGVVSDLGQVNRQRVAGGFRGVMSGLECVSERDEPTGAVHIDINGFVVFPESAWFEDAVEVASSGNRSASISPKSSTSSRASPMSSLKSSSIRSTISASSTISGVSSGICGDSGWGAFISTGFFLAISFNPYKFTRACRQTGA